MSLPDFSPADCARVITPQEAAYIIWESIMLRMSATPEYRMHLDRIVKENINLQWFRYCLYPIARQAGTHD